MRRDEVPLLKWCGYTIRAVRVPFEVGARARIYKAREGDLWDYVAWTLWDDEGLWYILADVNGVVDPFIPLGSGETVVVPKIR